MRSVRSRVGACLVGACAIVACSGSSSVSASACSHLYSAFQSYFSRCNQSGFFITGQADRAAKSCEQSLSAPGSTTTSADLDACASAIENLSCNTSKAFDALTSCTKPGTVPNGGPCSGGIQCQSSQCSVSTGDMCGVCQPTSKAGEPCDAMLRCGIGLVCNGPTTGTCAKPVYNPNGAVCDSYAQRCDDNLHCDGATKKCVPFVPVGGMCASSNDCDSAHVCTAQKCADPPGQGGDCSMTFRCASNFVCDYAGSKTCVPRTYSKPGQACSSISPCETTLSCPQSKVCPGVIADGQPCNVTDMTKVCDYGARCLSGVCSFGVAMCK